MERVEQIYKKVEGYQAQGLVSICIITKDQLEGECIYKMLRRQGLEVEYLKDEKSTYNGKVAVMPSYLTKGLEFDAVILYDVSAKRFTSNELDIKLLYVMITRALHEVSMYSIGSCTEAVASLNEKTFV